MTEEVAINFENTATAFASKSDAALKKMNWMFGSMNFRPLVAMGTALIRTSLKAGLPVKGLIKKTLFSHFCGGETIEECQQTIRELSQYSIGTILDYSAEGIGSEESFDATAKEIQRTILKASISLDIPFCVFKPSGIASTKLLAKVQSGVELDTSEKKAFGLVRKRFEQICATAAEKNVRLLIDAEETWIQKVIDEIAYEMMERYNRERPLIYNTYQMYCVKKLDDLRQAFRLAAQKRFFLGAKLVRGAYMEKEREKAQKMGYPDPIHKTHEASNEDFDKALKFCIEKKQRIAVLSGTHNEYSNYYLTVLMNKYNIKPNDPNVFFAQLYGMSDHISYNLSKQGYNVAKYVPYGPVEVVLPYLFRRAEENTSIAGQTSRELSLIRKEMRRRKAER